MTGTLTLDDIDIVRDSNGNLVIRDDTDTTIATYDTGVNEWQFAADVNVQSNGILNAVLNNTSLGNSLDASGNDLNNLGTATADIVTLSDTSTDPTSNGEARLNGTDVKVRSGGATRNLSNIGSGGGSSIFEDTNSDGVYEQTTGTGIEAPLVNAGELSGINILDPEASDWGTALNNEIASASQGDTILIPPVDYQTATEAVIDKSLSIVALGPTRQADFSNPTIERTSDVPFLSVEPATGADIDGLSFKDGGTANTANGLNVHHVCTIRDLTADGLGNHFINLEQNAANSNLNQSRVEAVEGINLGADCVRIQNTSGDAPNINAMEIDVRGANGSRWCINQTSGTNAAIGNSYHVQLVEGTTGGIKTNSRFSKHSILYIEGGVTTGVELNNTQNSVELTQVPSALRFGDEVVLNGNIANKIVRNYSSNEIGQFAGGGNTAQYGVKLDNNGSLTTVQR